MSEWRLGLLHLGISDPQVMEAIGAGFAAGEQIRIVRAMEGFPDEARHVLPWLLDASMPADNMYAVIVAELVGALGKAARSARPGLEELERKIRKAEAETMPIGSYSPQIREYRFEEALEAIDGALRKIGGP